MINQTTTVGTAEWREASKSWRIYAYVPNTYQTNVAEQLLSRGLDLVSTHEEGDSARVTMFASEAVLKREWNTAEEDEAWAHL
jgi:hypothetical protein